MNDRVGRSAQQDDAVPPEGRRFIALLAMLGVVLLALPFVRACFPGALDGFLSEFIRIAFLAVLFAALYAVCRSRAGFLWMLALLVSAAIAESSWRFSGSSLAATTSDALYALFAFACAFLIVGRIFDLREVSFDTVCACLCAYLFLGLGWARLYLIVEQWNPGAFVSSSFAGGGSFLDGGILTANYFSLVTLSTLGFGDIVPVNPDLRVLVAAQAVFGQIYLAVVVARLVAMHLVSSRAG
jgi:hypothetical protein